MNIYILIINETEKTTYKTYKEAMLVVKNKLNDNPQIKYKIFEEDYNDDLHDSNVCCRIYLLDEN